MAILLIVFGYKNSCKDFSENDTAEPKAWLGFVIGGIMTGILMMSLFIDTPITIGKIFNPEYSAVKSLVEMVK